MKRVAVQLDPHRYLISTLAFSIASLAIGFTSQLLRPYAESNGTHREAFIEYFFVMPALCIAILLRYWRIPLMQALPRISIQLFSLWTLNLIGHLLGSIKEPVLDDIFGVIVAFFVGTLLVSIVLLLVTEKVTPLQYGSTDCSGCGYSLKGLGLAANCPECGQPFTAESLGVDESELRV